MIFGQVMLLKEIFENKPSKLLHTPAKKDVK